HRLSTSGRSIAPPRPWLGWSRPALREPSLPVSPQGCHWSVVPRRRSCPARSQSADRQARRRAGFDAPVQPIWLARGDNGKQSGGLGGPPLFRFPRPFAGGLGSDLAVEPLLEPLHLAGRVDDRLLAREERVAVGADVDAQFLAG